VDRLVETMTEELDIPCLMVGSTTWRRADLDRGLEPDECYYFFDHPEPKIPRAAAYGSTAWRPEPISSASRHQDPSNCWDPDHWARGNWTPTGPRSLRQFITALILHEGGSTGTPPTSRGGNPGARP
jgi:hypothetical protein